MLVLAIESEIVTKSHNPLQFKQQLKKDYDSIISIRDAFKIYNWYKKNNNKVQNIITQFTVY